jgi:hypothetical protein
LKVTAPNGKAEPQRRVGGTTSLNKITKVKKTRRGLRFAQASARRRESGAVGVGRQLQIQMQAHMTAALSGHYDTIYVKARLFC